MDYDFWYGNGGAYLQTPHYGIVFSTDFSQMCEWHNFIQKYRRGEKIPPFTLFKRPNA